MKAALLPIRATCFLLLLFAPVVGCGSSGQSSNTPPPLSPSVITATSNPQVANYLVTTARPASVHIQFGTDTNYGFSTSSKHTTDSIGGPVLFQVAGMRASTTYHMSAQIDYDDGSSASDGDHTFTTGAIPAGILPAYSVSTTSGLTPQPGIELVDPLPNVVQPVPFATDLLGNVIWTYNNFPERQSGSILYPVKLLSNSNLAFFVAPNSQTVLTVAPVADTPNLFRIIDLVGNTIQQITMTDLNSRLATAGFNLTLQAFSHDFVPLPNGHYLVIANTIRPFTDLPGYPGTIQVLGDVVVDLDQNLNPVWIWNEFDHLDVNRHPMNFSDWTHSNAIAYSQDDGNFLISVRHQNWILKVDYRDGAGTGNVLWKLGEQGDFKLEGATDPTDWFYAQHDVNFVSTNTTGSFKLAVMDNGNDRAFPSNVTCNAVGGPPCQYTTIPVMQVDENAKTASFLFHQVIPSNLFSAICGNTRVLENTNIEYDLAGVTGPDSYVFEVTPTASPQTVWQMHITGNNTYRVLRMPSLYPGVQW